MILLASWMRRQRMTWGMESTLKIILFSHQTSRLWQKTSKTYTNSCLGIRRFVASGFDTTSITCQYGTVETPPRVDVRPEILKRCKEWADYKLDDLLCSIQSSSPCQIDLGNLSGLEFIPADKLKVFINNNSKVFYKTWDSLRERKYVRQIDLDLPLFEDSPIMFPYCRENTIRDALRHLLNFSYPE